MPELSIRIFFILITAIYTFYKILNISPKNKYIHLFLIFLCIATAAGLSLFLTKKSPLNLIIPFCVFSLIMTTIEKYPLTLTYITSLFAYAFSYIVFTLSIIFTSLISLPFYCKNYEIPWYLIQIFIGIIQVILIYVCFRIPRLRKGMTFIYNVPSGNIGSTLCIVLIMLIIFAFQTAYENFFYMYRMLRGSQKTEHERDFVYDKYQLQGLATK